MSQFNSIPVDRGGGTSHRRHGKLLRAFGGAHANRPEKGSCRAIWDAPRAERLKLAEPALDLTNLSWDDFDVREGVDEQAQRDLPTRGCCVNPPHLT